MKKVPLTLALSAGLLVTGMTTVFAAEAVKAVLFPIQVVINQKAQALPTESPILNYNNQTYVPLRFFSEQLGHQIDYKQGPTNEQSSVSLSSPYSGSTEQGWHLTFLMQPGNHRDAPLSLMLNMAEVNPEENKPLEDRTYQFQASIYNVSKQDIVLMNGFKIDLEIVRADEDGISKIVWEGSIEHTPLKDGPVHIKGLPIPAANNDMFWGVQSPAWNWDGKDLNGVPLKPGFYYLRQKEGAHLQYGIINGSSEILTHNFNRSMANGLVGFSIRNLP
ncbi:copper amine oxidase N-terminal domain-containing protein [Paenibacillus radicis (ex Xue et al. 2023)]|uniref:Copper amine oxidase N-terminal domain-containing protein n=1 Tax=Paenibacillus radicis (ex Xue et al. 2023) TaxID=2972489 RepID=A0ABT1YHS2_9BACL|nr:copper amine oxidase N-terminal domain-containing protein [Paenibacillus radicis (ex Xue et al. 2023)]MCR8632737.1 copper amine oxidase N-terminal domain-containing protein [Paenibacillus radicis (ex Xue et al. 2023)]